MVKHNNVLPNIHCHKKYMQSSRGPLKVKLNLDQATRKKARRIRRAKKAAAIAPRPVERLRPVVHCPTQKYNAKLRLGKGFTLEELRTVGFQPRYALSVGIAIDWRRRNRSQESLDANVARLEEYKKNLVIIKKGGESAPDQYKGTIQPLPRPSKELVTEKVTNEMKDFKAFTTMRVASQETRVDGYRVAVVNRKKKE